MKKQKNRHNNLFILVCSSKPPHLTKMSGFLHKKPARHNKMLAACKRRVCVCLELLTVRRVSTWPNLSARILSSRWWVASRVVSNWNTPTWHEYYLFVIFLFLWSAFPALGAAQSAVHKYMVKRQWIDKKKELSSVWRARVSNSIAASCHSYKFLLYHIRKSYSAKFSTLHSTY